MRSRTQFIPIRHLTRNGINATLGPRSCNGPRTSQDWEITRCIKRICALTPPRNGEAPSIRDAKFAWYKKASSLLKNKAKYKRKKDEGIHDLTIIKPKFTSEM
jgi:hypothetical protein